MQSYQNDYVNQMHFLQVYINVKISDVNEVREELSCREETEAWSNMPNVEDGSKLILQKTQMEKHSVEKLDPIT